MICLGVLLLLQPQYDDVVVHDTFDFRNHVLQEVKLFTTVYMFCVKQENPLKSFNDTVKAPIETQRCSRATRRCVSLRDKFHFFLPVKIVHALCQTSKIF